MSVSTSVVPAAESANLVRVSVASGDRVSDLVLPSRLPIAEILPDVASIVGALDPYEVHGGFTLVQPDGRRLDPDTSLLAQGVHDGALLSLVAGADLAPVKVYDDLVEAVADAVETGGTGWGPAEARAGMLATAASLLAVGALVVALRRDSGPLVPAMGAAATVLLLLAGAVFARARHDRAAATVVLGGAAAYAVVTALAATPGEVTRLPLLVAGTALAVVGGIATLVLPDRGWTFVPCFVLGFAGIGIGAVLQMAPQLTAARVLAVILVVTLLVGSLVPWFALSAVRALPAPLASENEILADPAEIDPERVAREVTLAHEVVLGLSVSVAILVVLSAPAIAGLGWAGLGLVWVAGLAQVLRTRQFMRASDVLVGLVGGAAAVLTGTVAGVLTHPEWGPVVAGVVAAAAVGVLAVLATPAGSSVRSGRLLDLAEGLVLFAAIPLLVVAVGLLGGH